MRRAQFRNHRRKPRPGPADALHAGGLAVATLNIAVNEFQRSQDGGDPTKVTHWFRIVAFGRTAEVVAAYLHKGSKVAIQGALVQRAWQDQNGKSGFMEFRQSERIENVGGLDNLKAYIRNRAVAFEPGSAHLPRPKGILLVGIPRTGKSLSCKATASILGWPLIRLEIGAFKGSLVGESERRMRHKTRTIDAFGEAVIRLDEVEKALAGTQSSGRTDSGTTAAMFGHFLNWMQEATAPVLIMATANNISQLPPEFLRAGRFDAIFFVYLPGRSKRSEIITIMNRRYGAEIPDSYSEDLVGFTGAEIEQLAKDSLFDGLDQALANIASGEPRRVACCADVALNPTYFVPTFHRGPEAR